MITKLSYLRVEGNFLYKENLIEMFFDCLFIFHSKPEYESMLPKNWWAERMDIQTWNQTHLFCFFFKWK